ncbi:UDP-glucuronosyltransferase 2C1 [Blattella germanica]|nr:UDP-glucuronosyltransferase 2C1 [Blattella germanica]
MGSILRSSALPDSKRNALLGAFSKIKQNVLWKWENDSLPGQPKNVKLSKWFPQSDILGKFLDRGVPMVGIPIFGDQRLNMERAKSAGYGIILDFKTLSTSSVSLALNEVLNNPKYRENAQRISRIYRDQPLQPLDQAVYWTEYVLRHKGALHMRCAALDHTWYQYLLLDVIAALLLAFCLCIFVIIHIFFKCLVIRVRGSRSDSDKKNK